MSSSLSASLAIAQQIVIRYIDLGLLVFGVVGSVFNVILFSRRQLRKNSCCTSSLAALSLLLMGIIPLLYAQFNSPNPLFIISAYCKIRIYVNQLSAMSCRWLLVMACVDRCAACSANVRFRQFCTVVRARRIVGLLVIIWMVLPVHVLIFYNTVPPRNNACMSADSSVAIYNSIYTLVMGSALPPTIMLACTLFIRKSLKNKNQRRTMVNMVQSERHNHARDQQVLIILLAQVAIFIISTIPFMSYSLYSTLTRGVSNKSSDRLAIESFVQVITELFVYIFPASTFYSNTLVSRTFRNELVVMLKLINIFDRIQQRRVVPINQTRTKNEINGIPMRTVRVGQPMIHSRHHQSGNKQEQNIP